MAKRVRHRNTGLNAVHMGRITQREKRYKRVSDAFAKIRVSE
jgi:hypothetical protein